MNHNTNNAKVFSFFVFEKTGRELTFLIDFLFQLGFFASSSFAYLLFSRMLTLAPAIIPIVSLRFNWVKQSILRKLNNLPF